MPGEYFLKVEGRSDVEKRLAEKSKPDIDQQFESVNKFFYFRLTTILLKSAPIKPPAMGPMTST